MSSASQRLTSSPSPSVVSRSNHDQQQNDDATTTTTCTNASPAFQPYKRANSGPWLQKPLHATLAEIEQSNHSAPPSTTVNASASANANASVTSCVSANTSEHNSSQHHHHPLIGPSSTHSSISHYNTIGSQHGDLNGGGDANTNTADANANVNAKNDDNDDNHNNHIGQDNTSNNIQRHLSLFDLVNIGVGGTIGSGIFVLCGYIAHNFAGPATCISWTISGIAACLSGVCYAELACRMPAAGSSYVYVYASMGELPAVLVAACLSLEYGISASAVARSWGDKCIQWLTVDLGLNGLGLSSLSDGTFNPLAMFIAAASVALLMGGVKESKSVTNFFTMTKVGVVMFMSLVGLMLMKPGENLVPFIPPQYGVTGIFRGATSSFFGYIGFDEVCCVAGEAMDPQRNMPLAIVTSLSIVTILYIIAALALTGMLPFGEISEVSGFPDAFQSRGWGWAAQISAFGEIFTLPIVVLISLMAQPRLQYALAKDGLLPQIFARVDDNNNIWHGTVISGVIMVLIASFIPFEHLNDMISAGILVAFCMTDSSLIIMRHESPADKPGKVEKSLAWFNAFALFFGISSTHFIDYLIGNVISVVSVFGMLVCLRDLSNCPKAVLFGGSIRASQYKGSVDMRVDSYFKTPCMPFIPCLGIFVNWYLISQLELIGIGFLLGYLGAAALFYFSYGMHNSVGANGGWEQYENFTECTSYEDADGDENAFLNPNWSPPPPLFNQPNLRNSSESLKELPKFA